MGHPYQSWWTGSDLDIEESRRLVPHQNATTMQVAISVVAACMWMIENPRRGVCVPDDLPHDYILDISKPYLGTFVSVASDWTPLKHYYQRVRRLQPAAARPDGPVAVQELPGHGRRLVDETNAAAAGQDTRHAARCRRPQGVAGQLRAVPQAPAARAGLLRRQGQHRPGDRPDVLRGRRELRRRRRGRVPDRPREHQGPAGEGAAGLHLGQDHLRQSHQGRTRRSSSSIRTSRWSPTTTTRRSSRSQVTRRMPGLVLRLRVPNTGAMVELSSKFGAAPGEAVDLIAFAATTPGSRSKG